MSFFSLFSLFARHAAYASAILLGLACVAERLAPGSVLSYVSLWQLVGTVFLIQLSAMLFSHPFDRLGQESQRIFLFGAGFTSVVFLALLVKEQGTKGLLLVAAATGVLVLGVASFPVRTPDLDEE
jgi:hypothetical protein